MPCNKMISNFVEAMVCGKCGAVKIAGNDGDRWPDWELEVGVTFGELLVKRVKRVNGQTTFATMCQRPYISTN